MGGGGGGDVEGPRMPSCFVFAYLFVPFDVGRGEVVLFGVGGEVVHEGRPYRLEFFECVRHLGRD